MPCPAFAARGFPDVARLSLGASKGLDVASSGSGSSNHLLVVRFARTAAARLNHAPYRGAGPAMTDVTAGVAPSMPDSLPSAAGRIRAGSVRALSPEERTALVRAEAARWKPLARASGAAAE